MEKGNKVYTISLSGMKKAERINRSKTATKILKAYLSRHFKGKDVKISRFVNEYIWKRGAKKPASKIRIVIEEKDGVLWTRLPDEKEKIMKKEKVKKSVKKESKNEKSAQTPSKKTEIKTDGKEKKPL